MKSKWIERIILSSMIFSGFSIEALHEMIDQQSQQLKDLNEKTTSLSSQLESQTELIRQK
jgi:hypothetical protein